MPAPFAYLLADCIFLGWGNGPESNAGGLLFERRASVFPSTTLEASMALNKPNDNARKGAVKKRTQLATKVMGKRHGPNGTRQPASSWTKRRPRREKR
jgi:hypothetical protein